MLLFDLYFISICVLYHAHLYNTRISKRKERRGPPSSPWMNPGAFGYVVVKGKFFFSCPQKTALFLANKLCSTMGLPESQEFAEMEHSVFSEISNMIGGTAATNFSLAGRAVNISPPSIIEGSQIIATVLTRQILKISLLIDGNPAHLFLAVQ